MVWQFRATTTKKKTCTNTLTTKNIHNLWTIQFENLKNKRGKREKESKTCADAKVFINNKTIHNLWAIQFENN